MSSPEYVAHENLEKLLWWNDGPKRNYSIKCSQEAIYQGDMIPQFRNDEPSVMSMNDTVSFEKDASHVKEPPYYPTYSDLTAEQRGAYWTFLQNPYEGDAKIGYVFLLYYGLERHLVEGDLEAAVKAILALRKAYDNSSFQLYSAHALIISILSHQRLDLLQQFIDSLEKNFEYQFSCNLYAICKFLLGMPLIPEDLVRMAREVGFQKPNYIKNYPAEFISSLMSQIKEQCGKPYLFISDFFTSDQWDVLEKQSIAVYANVSLNPRRIDVPFLLGHKPLKETIRKLLEKTHEEVKIKLRHRKQAGKRTNVESKKTPHLCKPLQFDARQEKQLLKKYALEADVIKRHFVCIELQDFYYKYRSINDNYVDQCIRFCLEDIEHLHELNTAYANRKLTSMFIGTISAFSRLAIIYEKRKEYVMAEAICDMAITYYTEHGKTELAESFFKRYCRIQDKKNK